VPDGTVAAGVATPVARSPMDLTVLTEAGAVYLAWLGITTPARPPTPRAGADAVLL
jgi:threonine/homoserine/homoserine lactone efflux protein